MTDTNLDSWRTMFEQEKTHLWAQAIRIGNRLGIRVRNQLGNIHIVEIVGTGLFEQTYDGQVISLLDVRISQSLGIAKSSVFVHLLSQPVQDRSTVARICKQYLSDAGEEAVHIECTVGADDIRPSDSHYLVNTVFT